ncbi:glycine cleavage system aminomethyltransferase GcvT [Glaciimonas soli]|uniref:aminomethyltransferase n=1 Tax=Glaciimonas soli TaxID=2590999 RepID=A0A843YNK5_9BURK|nr:glycine cleavage system aminomethyltransferase GcvT [Glaciimonas soli]MQQ99132.1 glycine cleavage system aminomethyltransferase GcvT [Glaciimonas soli]
MTTEQPLLRTPLYNLHLELGAKMVPFAGYDMPVQYPMGILKEHLHTRAQAGLFDVSHMGQVRLTGKNGKNAAAELETLVPVDIVDLPLHQQRYALFTNPQGGILDDLMVANNGDHLFIVVNAACKQADIAHLHQHLADSCIIEELSDRALLALQGPAAASVMARLVPETSTMIFMQTATVTLAGAECYISRSGYTGEDGFEISVPNAQAEALARLLLAQPEVAPIGLGARDSLRLEAGLCLYGHDMDEHTTPIEASLTWAISKARRADGVRAGGFPGAEIILKQLATGTTRKRVGLRPEGRPVREGAQIHGAEGKLVGAVSSGGFGASANGPVAMGYVATEYAQLGTKLDAMVSNKAVVIEVVKLPFVQQRYYRG